MFYFQAKPTITVGTKKVTREATKEKFNSIFVQSHRMFSFFSNCATTVQFVGPLCSILVVAKPGVSSKKDAITKSLSRFFFLSHTHHPTTSLVNRDKKVSSSGSSPKTAFTSTHSKSE